MSGYLDDTHNLVMQVADTGIQTLLYNCLMCSFAVNFPGSQCQALGWHLHRGTSLPCGCWDCVYTLYHVIFDEAAWKTGSQCRLLRWHHSWWKLPSNRNVRTVVCQLLGWHPMAIETAFIYSTLSFQGLTLDSCFNVKQNTIEFKKTIPRKFLHPKKGKSC